MAITYGTILLIDGKETRRQNITDFLRQHNWYDLTVADALPVGLRFLAERPFEVILLDVALGICQHPRLLDQLRQAAKNSALIILGSPAELDDIRECTILGMSDYILSPVEPLLLRTKINSHLEKGALQRQLNACIQNFNEVKKLADDLRELVLPLGETLTAEKRLSDMFDRIVQEALTICQADCGRLYLRRKDQLHLVSQQINSLVLHGTLEATIPHERLPLYDSNGEPNNNYLITHVAHAGETMQLADLYETADFDLSDIRRFDQRLGYRSASCLTIPLLDSKPIGVLQLINAQNQQGNTIPFSQYHRLVAESVARQAALVLHNRDLQRRHEKLLRYEREIGIARDIQSGFFPQTLPQLADWEVAASIQTAREVGGDFYDAFMLPSGKLIFLVADVCGKGVAAALFTALFRTLLRGFIQQFYQLHEMERRMTANETGKRPSPLRDLQGLVNAVEQTNYYVTTIHERSYMFVTLFMGMLDPKSGQLMYVNCGHNPPLLFNGTTVRQVLSPTGPAIGLQPGATFDVATLRLDSGDFLLVYTDGLTEARDENGRFLTTTPIYNLINTPPGPQNAHTFINKLRTQTLDHISPNEPADDITILALQRK